MAIEIPSKNRRQLYQYNGSDVIGDIDSSFNLELSKNKGVVKVNRMLQNFDSTDAGELKEITAIELFFGEIYLLTENRIFKGSDNPNESFTASNIGSHNTTSSDMASFNDDLYITSIESGNLRVTKGQSSSWSLVVDASGYAGVTLTEPYGNHLYIVHDYVKVTRIDKSDVVSSTTGTLDLGITDYSDGGYQITSILAGTDRLWIGLSSYDGSKGLVYTWDGETQNTPSSKYEIDYGIMSGVIKDGIPYFIDAKGKLIRFNGGSFVEVARLPFKDYPLAETDGNTNLRWIHPNGMSVVGDEIYLNIANRIYIDYDYNRKLHSGIWAFNQDNGLYHKYAPSKTESSILDHGIVDVYSAGAIREIPRVEYNDDKNGDFMAGYVRYVGSSTTKRYIACYNDLSDTTQKYGFFETKKIFANSIEDTWQKLYVVYKQLLNSTDKIIIKYRTDDNDDTVADITWTDTSTFTTTKDVSDYSVGDEITVLRGLGSGKTAHIDTISESGGTYTITLDETFTGASSTARVVFSKWIKLGEVTNDIEKNWKALTISKKNTSSYIRFKVCMQFTGDNQLYKLRVINKANINE